MTNNNILVPIDFTNASRKAAWCAASFAKIAKMEVSLLNIKNKGSKKDDSQRLNLMVSELESEFSVGCSFQIRDGSILSEISNAASEPSNQLVVIGSRGIKGIRELLLGADILKLVKIINIPVLCIQEGFSFPITGLQTILMPAASHTSFQNNIDAIVFISRLFDSEVHIYTIEKFAFPWPENLKRNIEAAINTFEKNNIRYKTVNEQESTYSSGYARQTLLYAGKIKADLISVMSVPSFEYYYFADVDKERLLTNKLRIPVLCVSDIKRS